MTPFINTTIRAGSTGGQLFKEHWDTQIFHVTYDELDPTFTFDPAMVRIIITANSQREHPDDYTCAPVGYVQNIGPTGFDIIALNTDSQGGQAGFNWMAIAETPEPASRRIFGLRMALSHPLHFEVSATLGDWQIFRIPFSTPFISSFKTFPVRLLTGSNHGRALTMTIVPDHRDLTPASLYTLFSAEPYVGEGGVVGAVGVATDFFQPDSNHGVTFLARNQDAFGGQCAFYHVALDGDPHDLLDPQILVDTGTTPDALEVFSGGDLRGYRYWHIYFSRPFLTPPVVLLTATDQGVVDMQPTLPPVQTIGQAYDVTPYGFTLVARDTSNLDTGKTFLHWVALGCTEPFLV